MGRNRVVRSRSGWTSREAMGEWCEEGNGVVGQEMPELKTHAGCAVSEEVESGEEDPYRGVRERAKNDNKQALAALGGLFAQVMAQATPRLR